MRAEKPKRPLASRCRLVRSYSSGGLCVDGFDSSVTVAGLAGAPGGDGVGARLVPQPLGARVRIVVGLLELLVEPAARVLARRGAERAVHFPVVARHERADLLLALDQDRERRRLHAAHGRQLEAARLRVERGHRARAVDADEPVGLGAARRGVGQRQHARRRCAALAKPSRIAAGVIDCSHSRLIGLVRLRVLHDVAEDELALAPGVAGVDQRVDVLALDELQQRLQPRSRSSRSASARSATGIAGQVRERPLAALDLFFLRHADLEQVPDRRRERRSRRSRSSRHGA